MITKILTFRSDVKFRNALTALRAFSTASSQTLQKTALYDFHIQSGGKMIDFGGWNLPVMYKSEGIMASHLHTRSSASIFDVSHMGQVKLYGSDRLELVEQIVPGDIKGLSNGQMKLTTLTNENGGIIDDTIVTMEENHIGLVINGACRAKDMDHINNQVQIAKSKGKDLSVELLEDQALIALQGPKSMDALQKFVSFDLKTLPFMSSITTNFGGFVDCKISRCGYTGEDGFEISTPNEYITKVTQMLAELEEVKLAGLGARDSLRLEAGFCLYGHDLNDNITPIEAGLAWTIGKNKKTQGGFLGADKILDQIKNGVSKKRVGLIMKDRAPPMEGASIQDEVGNTVGTVTSSVFSPSLQKAIAMGYVNSNNSKVGTPIIVDVRGKLRSAIIEKLPFVKMSIFKVA